MTAIPAEKLDKLVQRWESIQSELNKGVAQATRVQLSKEFAELNPVVSTIQALRKAEAERSELEALLADPAADKELAATGARGARRAGVAPDRARAGPAGAPPAQGCGRREERHHRGAGRHRRRRGGPVRRRPLPHVQPLCRAARLEDRDHLHLGERSRRLQGDRGLDLGQGRVRAPQVRVRRAPRAARSGHRDERAHSYLRRDGRGAAGGGGHRARHQARGHPHRHHARGRRRRPARQQDRLGRAHHASADRHHRRLGGEIAAPEPPPRHAGAALAALRAGARRRPPMRGPPSARVRSAPATARSASAPTISRRAA